MNRNIIANTRVLIFHLRLVPQYRWNQLFRIIFCDNIVRCTAQRRLRAVSGEGLLGDYDATRSSEHTGCVFERVLARTNIGLSCSDRTIKCVLYTSGRARTAATFFFYNAITKIIKYARRHEARARTGHIKSPIRHRNGPRHDHQRRTDASARIDTDGVF